MIIVDVFFNLFNQLRQMSLRFKRGGHFPVDVVNQAELGRLFPLLVVETSVLDGDCCLGCKQGEDAEVPPGKGVGFLALNVENSDELLANEQRNSDLGATADYSLNISRIVQDIRDNQRLLVGCHPPSDTFFADRDAEVPNNLFAIAPIVSEAKLLASFVDQQNGTVWIVEELLDNAKDFVEKLSSSWRSLRLI